MKSPLLKDVLLLVDPAADMMDADEFGELDALRGFLLGLIRKFGQDTS